MKKRFLTAFLSVMMVVCLSVSATALLASAAAVGCKDRRSFGRRKAPRGALSPFAFASRHAFAR